MITSVTYPSNLHLISPSSYTSESENLPVIISKPKKSVPTGADFINELGYWIKTLEGGLRAVSIIDCETTTYVITKTKMIYDNTQKTSSTPCWSMISYQIPSLVAKVKKSKNQTS